MSDAPHREPPFSLGEALEALAWSALASLIALGLAGAAAIALAQLGVRLI